MLQSAARVQVSVVNLTPDELLGQAAAMAITEAAGLNVGASAAPATRKIAAASSQEVAELLADAEAVMTVLDMKLADHSRHQETVRTVQWALIEKKQVTGQYVTPYQEKPVKLTLHPYRLCFAGQAWYLIGRPVDEKAPKTYRVARFQSLRMVDAAAQRPTSLISTSISAMPGASSVAGRATTWRSSSPRRRQPGDRNAVAQDAASETPFRWRSYIDLPRRWPR